MGSPNHSTFQLATINEWSPGTVVAGPSGGGRPPGSDAWYSTPPSVRPRTPAAHIHRRMATSYPIPRTADKWGTPVVHPAHAPSQAFGDEKARRRPVPPQLKSP